MGRKMIGVIINPNALGVRRRRGLRDRLAALAGRHAEVVETHTPAELGVTLQRFHAAGIGVIATCGGGGPNLSPITQNGGARGTKSPPSLPPLRGRRLHTLAA